MGKRVHNKHVVMVAVYYSWKYNDDRSVKYWVMDVGMDLDGDETNSVVIDFKPRKGDLLVIRQTSKLTGACYVWTKVEDE